MSRHGTAAEELDRLIEEITVDCYNEDEELTAFETAFDENWSPCCGTVFGEDITVVSVHVRSGRRELVASCERDGRRYEVALLDVVVDADGDAALLVAAYRHWVRGFG